MLIQHPVVNFVSDGANQVDGVHLMRVINNYCLQRPSYGVERCPLWVFVIEQVSETQQISKYVNSCSVIATIFVSWDSVGATKILQGLFKVPIA